MAVECLDEDVVEVPLGLVALNWVRMYLPLVGAGLPHAPRKADSWARLMRGLCIALCRA